MITDPPEAAFIDIAAGEFGKLSLPIYLACGHESERRQFLEQHQLAPHQVLRVRHAYQIPTQCREDKVLILAPRWSEDRATDALVSWWVDCDRYTFAAELEAVPFDDEDRPPFWERRLSSLALGFGILCIVAAGVEWSRAGEWLPWSMGCLGWFCAAALERSNIRR